MALPSSAEASLWPEHWAISAATEADHVEYQMRVADPTATTGGPPNPSAEAVAHHLAATRAACRRDGASWRRRRRSIPDRWRGASVEQAYRNLHSAKVFLVDLLPQVEVDALVPAVSTRIAMVFDRSDPRRTEADRALRSPDAAVRRATIKRAMADAYHASDEEYVRLRDFRNIVMLTTIALALFTGILLAAVNLSPKAIPLCFAPGVTSTAVPAQPATTVCPSGDHRVPTGGDVLIVAGLGAVGGGLGALFAIRNLRGTSTPYGVPTALAVLKVPAGALTSVIGILLLAGEFVPGLSNLDTQRQILAYALLFGYAQQLLTRLADNQAQTLLNRLPSRDPQAPPPRPPAGPPPGPRPSSAPSLEPAPNEPGTESAAGGSASDATAADHPAPGTGRIPAEHDRPREPRTPRPRQGDGPS